MHNSFRRISDQKPGKWMISFCLFILYACQFQPDDVYFKEVEKPDFSTLEVYIDSEEDILVYKPTTFKFVITEGAALKRVDIYLDTTSVSSITRNLTDTLSFVIDPTDYENASYVLRVTYVAAPNNNSLGDILGFEEYEIWKELKLTINTTPPPPVEIDSILIENGTLRLTWSAPEIINFDKYHLRAGSATIELDNTATGTKFQQFISGNINFRIDIETPYFDVEGTNKTFSLTETLLSAEIVDSNFVKIIWKKPLLYQNVDKIKIVKINRFSEEVLMESSQILNDSIRYEKEIFFAENYKFQARFYYKNVSSPYSPQYHSLTYEIALGDSIPSFLHMTYDPTFNKYFLKSLLPENSNSEYNNVIYRLNNNLLVESQANFLEYNNENPTITTSPDGQKVLTVTSNSLRLLEFNALTMTLEKETYFGSYITSTNSFTRRAMSTKLASNNLVFVKTLGQAIVLDSKRENTVFSEPATLSGDNIDFSPTGDILYFYGIFYERMVGKYQKSISLSNLTNGRFIEDGNLLSVQGNGIIEISPKTGTIVNSFIFDALDSQPGQSSSISNAFIDKERDVFVYIRSDKVSIYRYSTGRLIKQLQTGVGFKKYYFNGTLFSTNGRALKYY